jgi:tRNA(adenine34) deaminase
MKSAEEMMDVAIEQARRAFGLDEVPIGAVIFRGDDLISACHNRRILDSDPTAHAEMLAIRQAAARTGDWRLNGCTLAVTLEPCCMCAGAIVLARLDRLVYGAVDPKGGAVDTLYRICDDVRLNHRVEVVSGIRAEVCGQLLTRFFRKQRSMGKK